MIPQSDLASIRQRLAGSAPAPWVVERDASGARRIRTAAAGPQKEIVIWRDFEPAGDADVEFIALARNLMDKLVEAADRRAVDIVSQEELDRLEAAARQATAGPWTPVLDEQPEGSSSFIRVGADPELPDMYVWLGEEFAPRADVELIANARQDVPRLVLELRRLKD
ncbi:MAG TPA: hypothetical protein VJ010_00040 [Actinomycetota bacterium]|nr:hypothetical protein [Actinomycetota bacterium]